MSNPYAAYDPSLLTQPIMQGVGALMQGYMKRKEKQESILKAGKVAKGFLELYSGEDENQKEFLKKKPEENDFEYSQRLSSQAESMMMDMSAKRQQQEAQMKQLQIQEAQQGAANRAGILEQYKTASNLDKGVGQGVYRPEVKQAAQSQFSSPIGAAALENYKLTGEVPSSNALANYQTTMQAQGRKGKEKPMTVDAGDRISILDEMGNEVRSIPKGRSPSANAMDPNAKIQEQDIQFRVKAANEFGQVLRDKALAADEGIAINNRLADLLKGDLATGFGQEYLDTAKSVLGQLGMDTGNLKTQEEARSLIKRAWVAQVQNMRGLGALANQEGNRIVDTFAKESDTKQGFAANLAVSSAFYNKAKAAHALWNDTIRKGGTSLDAQQAVDEWWASQPSVIPSKEKIDLLRQNKDNPKMVEMFEKVYPGLSQFYLLKK